MRTVSGRAWPTIDGLNSVVDALSRIPESDEKQRLLAEARTCERVIQSWQHGGPTGEERDVLTKRVLNLHVAVTKLHRDSEPQSGTRRKRAGAIAPDDRGDAPATTGSDRPTGVPPFDVHDFAAKSDSHLRSAAPQPRSEVTVEKVRELVDRSAFEEALALARATLELLPLHVELRALALRCEEKLEESYLASIGSLGAVPRLALAPDEVRTFRLDPASRSILGRIDGKANVDAIVRGCPVPRLVVLRTLCGLVGRGIVACR